MKNFKRLLSAVLAVLMVLGMFSCLSTVVSAGSSDDYIHRGDNWDKTYANTQAYTTSQNNRVKTYGQLAQQYGSTPYMYYAVEVFEQCDASDTDPDKFYHNNNYWKPTNHIVQPGERLLLRFYFKSNIYVCAIDAGQFVSRRFFNIDPDNNSMTYDSSLDLSSDGLKNKGYTGNNTAAVNPNGPVTCYSDLVGTKNAYIQKNVGTSQTTLKTANNLTKFGFTAAQAYSWDYIKNVFSFVYDGNTYGADEQFGFDWTGYDDDPDTSYFSETEIAVRGTNDPLETSGTTSSYIYEGAVGYIGFDLNYTFAKSRNPGFNKGTYYLFNETDVMGSMIQLQWPASQSPLSQVNTHNNLIEWSTEDCNHIFVIGDDSGSTPSTGNSVNFYDGASPLADLTISNATGTVSVANVSYSKAGYTLAGWSTDGTAANIVTSVDASNGDVNLYAVWSVAVTFSVDGSTTSSNVIVGDNITFPQDPSKPGYTFVGWYDSADANQTIVTPPVAASAAVTYVAKFSQQFTVTFVDRGNTVGSQTGVAGTTINFPAETDLAANPGYKLSGWTPNDTTISGTQTYTAVWTEKDYTITYAANGGSGTIAPATVAYGANIPANDGSALSKTGCNFTGWEYTLDGAAYTGTTMPAGDLVATAQWTPGTFTATFKIDNGTTVTDYTTVDAVYGQAIDMPQTPSDAGYNYSAWAPQDGYTMDAEGKTYTTTQTPKYFNVTFEYSAPGVTPYELSGGGSMAYGSAVSFPTNVDPVAGMTFKGWIRSTDNEFIAAGGSDTVPASDVTYTTVFEGNAYDVALYVDNVLYDTIPVNYGAALSNALPDLSANAPTGYAWSGWKLQDGSAIPATMPSNNISLYSTNDIQQYTLTFYYGSVNGNAVYQTVTQNYNTDVSVADPEFAGFSFIGWNDTVPAKMPAENKEFTAQWTRNDYTATFVLNNGQGNITKTQAYESELTAPEVTREGYSFGGWSPEVPATMPAESKTYTAQWNINTYNLTYMVKDTGDSFSRYGNVETREYNAAVNLKAKKSTEGWQYTDWALEDGSPVPNNMPAGDLVVYSTGSKIVYTNKYYVDGQYYASRDVEYGATITHPDLPSVAGYTNPYWYPRTTVQPAEAIDFEYRGTAGEVNYTFTVMVEQLNGSYTETSETRTATSGSTVSATTTEKTMTGFTLNAESVTSTTVTSDGNAAIILVFDRNTYVITVNDASGTRTISYLYEAPIDPIVPATMAGNEFSKWTYKKTETGANTGFTALPATMPAFSFTATASYGVSTYTLTPYVDYADGNGFTALTPIDYEYGEQIATVAAQSQTGYTWSGWCSDQDCTTPYAYGTMPAQDVAIYGKFTINSYTLKFVNGVTGATIDSGSVAYNATVTYPNAPAVEGYRFTGWSETITNMPAGDKTITAYYARENYTITYNVDGVTTVKTYAYEAPIAEQAAPTKLGYNFSGWSEEIPATMPAHNIEVSATWAAKTGLTATFIKVDGDETPYDVVENITFDENFTAPAEDPQRQNYTFSGWKLQGTSDSAIVSFPYRMNAEGLTFVGVWAQDTSAVHVQSVTRLTTPYYQKGAAEYQVVINEPAFKLYITNGTTTWAFGKGSYYNNPEGSGIKSITTDAQTGNEIWVIELALAQKENGYKAYITTEADFYTDTEDQKLIFSVTYDERTPEAIETQCKIDSVTKVPSGDAAKVIRGEQVKFQVTTSSDVTWLKFNNAYTQKDGTVKSLNTLFKSTTNTDACSITENQNGTRTWVVTLTITYSCDDTRVDMDWLVYYKTGLTSQWVCANESSPIKMTVCYNAAAAVDTAEGYDKYTLIDAVPTNGTVAKGKRDIITVRTTDDCTKVRITVDGKSTTFQTTTANNVSYTDAAGIRTWKINYKYNPSAAGQYEVKVNARGTTWGADYNYNIVVS